MAKGKLYVISGPSGTGKGTLVARVTKSIPEIWVSLSATTRQPRTNEVDGVHYYFMTKEQFTQHIEAQEFLEFAEVHGNYYGTLREPIEERLNQGIDVLLEIDTQGAFQIRKVFPDAVLVFIEPPSLEELEHRLRLRGTESEEQIARRMQTAELELSQKKEYDIRLVNDDLDLATEQLIDIIAGKSKKH